MDRGDVLRKCAELLEKNREEIAYTEVRDIAKPIVEARFDVQGGEFDSQKAQFFQFENQLLQRVQLIQ